MLDKTMIFSLGEEKDDQILRQIRELTIATCTEP